MHLSIDRCKAGAVAEGLDSKEFGEVLGMRSVQVWVMVLFGGGLAATVAMAQIHETPTAGSTAADYQAKCSACHGASLEGSGAPSLKGVPFVKRWEAVGPDGLAEYIQKAMPPGASAPMNLAEAQGLARYIMEQNGTGGLARTEEPTKPIASQASDEIAKAAQERLAAIASKLTPVTDAMLRKSAGDDWLVWRGNTDATGYSELTQINRSNVSRLRMVWSKSLGPGSNGVSPLEHDGVIFIHAGGHIAALDALTGDTIWKRQSAAPPRRLTQPRGLALYDDAIYASTVGNHVLALDARTGSLLWDTFLGDQGVATAAPLVANGRVFQGVANCARTGLKCYLVALDAKTGSELWRFQTVPDDKAPGSESWGGAPAAERSGAGVWTAPSYRYEDDRVIFGTGNTYAVSTILRANPKKPAPALYSNTTLSLDAGTGKPNWHFQHVQGDVWDEDWAFERMLVPDPKGSGRQVAITMGKLGIIDALDQKSGKYLWSYDYGIQDLVTRIDPKTGVKTSDARKIPSVDSMTSACPYAGGVRNWPATAYDPARKLLIVPALDSCMELKIDESNPSGGLWSPTPRAGSENRFGRITAIDLATGREAWDVAERSPIASAALATAGGLVFVGFRDRWFRALDSDTGKTLWQTRLADTPNAFPITYSVNGRQFVAIVTGAGTYVDGFVAHLTPEIESSTGDPTLWVFEVSEH
ncbi:Glucose dehydrogenase, PQQ-dependent [Sphingobium indicum BiD32]|uniref:Glucose dehydrogenase, PQQ-dependent n=1 Tax=Sphingobium indicum BiD32 TaxID=1301087 RepID=N1MRX5_9SPHN|nr:Glucose dehydrogenase, PQQ-dependent [Sphingobium indicum BiD32]